MRLSARLLEAVALWLGTPLLSHSHAQSTLVHDAATVIDMGLDLRCRCVRACGIGVSIAHDYSTHACDTQRPATEAASVTRRAFLEAVQEIEAQRGLEARACVRGVRHVHYSRKLGPGEMRCACG